VGLQTLEALLVTLTRPFGNWAGDLDISRRSLALALAGGYALAAFSAEAEPIKTDGNNLIQSQVAFPAGDRDVPAFVARPLRGRNPVVFVYSEVFGIHEWVKDVCRRLAHAGYAAVAPDFFVRAGDPSKTEDMQAIRKIVAQASDRQVTSDTAAALKWIKAQPWADAARMGVIGFCWGGAKVWLACERFADFKAGVAFYGPLKARPEMGATVGPLELAKNLRAPVLGLYGGKDQGIPQADLQAMRQALKAAGKAGSEIVVYPQAQHGFFADYRPSYDAAASAQAWPKALAFLKAHGVG
jgi:carboxymethylenebutenolidase